jgi:hypothetical protein
LISIVAPGTAGVDEGSVVTLLVTVSARASVTVPDREIDDADVLSTAFGMAEADAETAGTQSAAAVAAMRHSDRKRPLDLIVKFAPCISMLRGTRSPAGLHRRARGG